MGDRLRFGTAGLRAALGEGPGCMNVQVVEQAAMAIARWLPDGSTVVIGRDARYGSSDFADVTARVLSEAGHVPKLYPDPVPTPVVAWAVGALAADAGVMVTASHNPATDNGYKVYAADGGQILLDDAATIERFMDELPWPDDVSTERPADLELLGQDMIDGYHTTIARELVPRPLTIAYTAMHGVGGGDFVRALQSAGHDVHSVPEQHDPDPDFPTAPFPNPEEPGTLDLVMALADSIEADLVLANDPDADRLAVAVRRSAGWERLTGDQIGVLLGWYLLGQTEGARAVATTIVSSSLLGKVAAATGATCHETLTGFKWLARVGSTAEPLVFAYEEALGYSVLPSIRDKDGISAGLVFAELVATIAQFDHTVDDVLANLYGQHGVHLTSQVSSRFEGDDAMQRMTQRMAELRVQTPTVLAGLEVVEVVDLIGGHGGLPSSDVLIYHLEGGRLIIRPSGTEPKIKAYLEAVDIDEATAQSRLAAMTDAVPELLV
ncbi:MAG: phospho-sugar mutase [Acidimicrobiia bacterium]|nr:phospho-sugar mutase [Acidimicrobiia bacterium]